MGISQTAAMAQVVAADTGGTAIGGVRDRAAELAELFSFSKLAQVVLLVAGTYALIAALSWLARLVTARLPRRHPFLMRLLPMLRVSLWLLCFYLIVVGVFEPSRESLIAFAAAAGIGIGFAAQDVLKNIFGGIIIAIDRPFELGDLVELAGHHGEVVAIGLRATRLRTRNDRVVSVPNAEVVSRPVSNANAGSLDCLVRVELLLPSRVDTVRVRQICYEAAATSLYAYPAKPIDVRIEDEFRETFLTKVRIQAYVYDHRLETAFASDVTGRAKRAFHESGLLADGLPLGPDPVEAAPYRARDETVAAGGPT